MTNSTTVSTQTMVGYARPASRRSDESPMVITRLSGWIDVGEIKSESRAWIIPTRIHAPAR